MNSILATKLTTMQEMVQGAPLLPGCYIYRNGKGKILYVGKAKVLRNRVKSYFSNYSRVEEKIRQMIDQAASIEFYVTDSEIEALILESVLIKKYKPKYNSMMVDDKNYIYVKFPKIETSKGEYVKIPTIETVREFRYVPASAKGGIQDTRVVLAKDDKEPGEYFGPYPDSRSVRRLLRRLRRIFPYCTSNQLVKIPSEKNAPFEAKNPKLCFEAQIGLCNGACAGQGTRSEYERNLNNIKKFFKGQKHELQEEITREMTKAAKSQEFEVAVRYRNMLKDIQYVGSNLHMEKDMDETVVMKMKAEKRERAQADLINFLQFPPEKLRDHREFRMECYDISNIQGRYAVASMVVFVNGQAEPSLYRRFRIRMKNEPNDFAMLQEVLGRRFTQLLRSRAQKPEGDAFSFAPYTNEEGFTVEPPPDLMKKIAKWQPDESFSQLPDLMIIDGGKGQLASSYKILQQFGLADTIPMIGLAKREEEIFKVIYQFTDSNEVIDKDSDFQKIHLPRTSEALYLIQRIRDEAHRFAITYHRKVRSKALTGQI